MVAGHETTSTAVTWTLFALTQASDVQSKLREELRGVGTDTPSMDVLAALPYLDKVVKESLRLNAPVPMTERLSMKDDLIPVSKPYTDRNGVERDTIAIKKNDPIMIPSLIVNRHKAFWGEDANEFKCVISRFCIETSDVC